MAKVRINIWIDDAQRDGLLRIKARDGVTESEQIRRGIDMWLDARLPATDSGHRTPPQRTRKRGHR